MLILMMGVVGITKGFAYDFSAVCETGQTLYYNYLDDISGDRVEVTCPGSYGWTGYTKPSGDIVIPSMVERPFPYGGCYNVVRIGSNAFKDCTSIESIDLGQVSIVSNDAFNGCSMLSSVNIPNTVTTIGWGAFYGCSNLTAIEIPDSVISIGEEAFGATALINVYIPSSVNTIDGSTFVNCSLMTIEVSPSNVTYDSRNSCNAIIKTSTNELIVGCSNTVIPNSVTSIDYFAFSGDQYLTFITIPNSVVAIKGYAFRNCTNLSSIELPNSITSIGDYAFEYCSGLSSLSVKAATPPTTAGNTFSGVDKSIPVYIPCGTSATYNSESWGGFTDFQEICLIDFVDSNVKALCVANWDTNGDGELNYDEAAAVTSLGNVFKNNTSITSFDELQYFTGLTAIGNQAFFDCKNITSIIIPNTVTSIGNYAFYNCKGITGQLIIPDAVTSIGMYAFYYCNKITSLKIGNSVTSVGTEAFSQCSGLTTVYYNGSIKLWCNIIWGSGYSNPLRYASELYIENNMVTEIVIPQDVTEIKDYAFNGYAGMTSLTIGNSVTSIGVGAFANCTNMTSLTIGNSVTNIGSSAFGFCTGISGQLILPNSVTNIGDNAFYNCSSITGSLIIPNSVTSINEQSFAYCSELTSVTIPNSVTRIESMSFYGCEGLTTIDFSNTITYIGSSAFTNTGWYNNQANGILYLNNWCMGYKGDKPAGVLNIYANTIGIASNAFSSCNGLTGSLIIPNSVVNIGDDAFNWCNGLTSLTIGNSVVNVGDRAFYCCYNLTGSLTIPNSVINIGSQAFDNCNGFTSLVIGNSMNNIGTSAFYKCVGLAEITSFANSVPPIGNNTFYNVNKSIPVYVPCSSISDYQTASGWNEFTNYQCMGSTSITGYGSSTDSDYWVFIASPLVSSVLPTAVDGLVADPEENYDLYRFNQSGENGEWENYKGHTVGFVLENGKGYLYANKNNVTLTFAGTMNMTASKEVELDYDGTANMSGWNLIGNPFTEAAYIDRPYYKMNATGTDVTPVETFGATPVAAYSGIVVHAETSGESVTFTKSGSKSSDNGGLQITLSKAGVRGDEAQDKVIVSFNKYAQLSKFIFNEDNAKLYIPMGGEDYAIAYSDRQSNMPLYFKTKEMGIYTMSFEGAIDNIKIIDNLDGSVIYLDAEKSFTFVGTPSDRNDRFTIVFNTPTTEDFAYQSGDGIVVNGEGELQVFDIMGRTVAKFNVNGLETVYIPCQSGVYVLRLLGKETKTQKIVVK